VNHPPEWQSTHGASKPEVLDLVPSEVLRPEDIADVEPRLVRKNPK
jgi:hypothetical protein